MAAALGAKQGHAELTWTERVLLGDAKNYHAWAHRQHFVGRPLFPSGALGTSCGRIA